MYLMEHSLTDEKLCKIGEKTFRIPMFFSYSPLYLQRVRNVLSSLFSELSLRQSCLKKLDDIRLNDGYSRVGKGTDRMEALLYASYQNRKLKDKQLVEEMFRTQMAEIEKLRILLRSRLSKIPYGPDRAEGINSFIDELTVLRSKLKEKAEKLQVVHFSKKRNIDSVQKLLFAHKVQTEAPETAALVKFESGLPLTDEESVLILLRKSKTTNQKLRDAIVSAFRENCSSSMALYSTLMAKLKIYDEFSGTKRHKSMEDFDPEGYDEVSNPPTPTGSTHDFIFNPILFPVRLAVFGHDIINLSKSYYRLMNLRRVYAQVEQAMLEEGKTEIAGPLKESSLFAMEILSENNQS